MRSAVVLIAPFMLGACASTHPSECAPEQTVAIQDSLYFGTAKPSGTLSEEEWTQFLATVVTPRFPQGLTVWPAAGQWRSATGRIVQESSHVLTLVHPDDPISEAAIREIVSGYKVRFQQEAVLRLRANVCMSF